MKKLLYVIILIFALPVLGYGFEFIAGKPPSGDAYDCDALRGDATLYWDGEYPGDETKACISGGTVTPTASANVEIVNGSTIGETGKWMRIDASGDYMYFGTEDLYCDGLEGRVEFDIYVSATNGNNEYEVIEQSGVGASSNKFRIQVNGVPKVYNPGTNVSSSQTLSDTTKYTIKLKWSNAGTIFGVRVDATAWDVETVIGPNDVPAAVAVVGNVQTTITDVLYITNVKHWNTYINTGDWQH